MTEPSVIYHITLADLWKKSLESGIYKGETLDTEGFIHFSKENQVVATANRYYRGVKGLFLLRVNPAKLSAELKYEKSTNGELYPHLYGPLNLEAVDKVVEFNPDPSGEFSRLPF
ncbi:glutathione S-transferase [Leptolinea sp. HRD-7]|nr:glutathione S-transferase [Leptolinea sp. HRD-7]